MMPGGTLNLFTVLFPSFYTVSNSIVSALIFILCVHTKLEAVRHLFAGLYCLKSSFSRPVPKPFEVTALKADIKSVESIED